ncbi:ExbD/TolR family protein [Roseibacillus ishigakijimensis]|uniref:Biopolymer transporter ExbD n=1 Tax=Roseibacillus ishigakijimensis TaxID=454146 RepID=A0A934VMD0_9BACT|nr:biopolymer transporter ExbD [Roseibacillus ishigakijimensis]MBK1834152.1 biopolymer transporter ExbD [Roseibacillus ishigakijimensis]
MKYSRRFSESEEGETQIDISPLIDIVFILVIFFIVTTVFNKEVGVEVNRPPQVASAKSLDRDSVMLALTDQGQVYYGGRNIGFDGIESVISGVQDGGDPIPVILICDTASQAEGITKVINAANLAGASSVSIATQK